MSTAQHGSSTCTQRRPIVGTILSTTKMNDRIRTNVLTRSICSNEVQAVCFRFSLAAVTFLVTCVLFATRSDAVWFSSSCMSPCDSNMAVSSKVFLANHSFDVASLCHPYFIGPRSWFFFGVNHSATRRTHRTWCIRLGLQVCSRSCRHTVSGSRSDVCIV